MDTLHLGVQGKYFSTGNFSGSCQTAESDKRVTVVVIIK